MRNGNFLTLILREISGLPHRFLAAARFLLWPRTTVRCSISGLSPNHPTACQQWESRQGMEGHVMQAIARPSESSFGTAGQCRASLCSGYHSGLDRRFLASHPCSTGMLVMTSVGVSDPHHRGRVLPLRGKHFYRKSTRRLR